jgi:hypothetical protein
MPTNRTSLYRHRRELTFEEEQDLRYGGPRAFASEEERRAAWQRCRNQMMATDRYGKRPAAWWDYDAPAPRPEEGEEAVLYEHQLLDEQETAELAAFWRHEFERVFAPGWPGHCIGHKRSTDTFATWIEGARGRQAHWRWAGIPQKIIKEWLTERRRRDKAIRKLKTAGPASAA